MSTMVSLTPAPDESQGMLRPWRWYLLAAAIGFTILAVYGSFVPFSYRPIGWHEALMRFQQVWTSQDGIASRADFVANILLFIPIGFFGLGVFACDRRCASQWWLAVVVVVLCAALSVALEFAQLWFPIRTTSRHDIVAETIGGFVGVLLWLVIGSFLLDWLRSYDRGQHGERVGRSTRRLEGVLSVYVVGMAIYAILPLDLTLAPSELFDKYQRGRLVLAPFSDVASRGLAVWLEPLCDAILFVPVGMFFAMWRAAGPSRVRSFGHALLLGGLFVFAVEGAQVLVVSRTASTTDLLAGLAGVGVGIGIWRRLVRKNGVVVSAPLASRGALALGAAGFYALFLLAVFCWPLPVSVESIVRDPMQLQARYDGFFVVPFARMYAGSEWNAMNEVARKLLFFLPLGSLLAVAWRSFSVPSRFDRVRRFVLVLTAAGVATAIEACQIFLPSHHADVTDVMLGVAGAVLGMMVTTWLLAVPRRFPARPSRSTA